MTYHRVTKLEYILEMENNFTVKARIQNERQEPTRFMPFVNGYGQSFGHYNMNSATVELRYAPGEKFYQMKTGRVPINFDAPIFTLSHTWAPKGVAGNPFALSSTEASFSKRFWFSAFGFMVAMCGPVRPTPTSSFPMPTYPTSSSWNHSPASTPWSLSTTAMRSGI